MGEEYVCCEDLLPGECLDCVGKPRPFVVIDGDRVAVEVLGLVGTDLRVRAIESGPGVAYGDVRVVPEWDVIRPIGEPATKRPVPLSDPSGNARAWACGACGLIVCDEGIAARCCVCTRCGHQLSRDRYRVGTEHSECNAARWKGITVRERQRYMGLDTAPTTSRDEAVVRLTEAAYDGPVFWSDRGPQDGYFASTGDLRAWATDHGEALPAWVYACTTRGLSLDAEAVLEAALDDMDESARESIGDVDVALLQSTLNEWIDDLDVPETWDMDHTRIVVLDREVAT